MTRIIVPMDMKEFPEAAIEHLYAYGIEEEQLLCFMTDRYDQWDGSQEECQALCEWFLKQQGFHPGDDANGHDVVGEDGWLLWTDSLRHMEAAVQYLKRQIDRFLRLEGYEAPHWPRVFLERTIGYDLVLSITPHQPGAINADAKLPQQHHAQHGVLVGSHHFRHQENTPSDAPLPHGHHPFVL
jgi:hypothetical protein